MVLLYFQKANDKGLGAEIWNDVLLHAMYDVGEDDNANDEDIDVDDGGDDDDDIGRKLYIHGNNNGIRVLMSKIRRRLSWVIYIHISYVK